MGNLLCCYDYNELFKIANKSQNQCDTLLQILTETQNQNKKLINLLCINSENKN